MADHLPGCSCCGETLDRVDLAIRSAWPDALLALTPRTEKPPGATTACAAPRVSAGSCAEARTSGTIPWLVAPPGGLMHRVLHDTWDRDEVLSRIAHALQSPSKSPYPKPGQLSVRREWRRS
ncbi:hypothetical protein [Actinoplanes sp. TFC3]|uniref:hypothetical protein n=1 Tax=Actinoplanes sp. TFC3 TaxID=1710355 RepID=UPI000A743454|nr:hypothetical protein [Actinoplanes sp. TFC3]